MGAKRLWESRLVKPCKLCKKVVTFSSKSFEGWIKCFGASKPYDIVTFVELARNNFKKLYLTWLSNFDCKIEKIICIVG